MKDILFSMLLNNLPLPTESCIMYEYPTIPFFHPDDPKFGNTLPPMTDQEWERLQQSHREGLTGIRKSSLTSPITCDKVCV